jgi:hypothetical protein
MRTRGVLNHVDAQGASEFVGFACEPSYRPSGCVAIQRVIGNSELLQSLWIGAGAQQSPPPEPVFEPLGNYGVIPHMSAEIARQETLPLVRGLFAGEFEVILLLAAAQLSYFYCVFVNSILFDA